MNNSTLKRLRMACVNDESLHLYVLSTSVSAILLLLTSHSIAALWPVLIYHSTEGKM